MNPPANISEPLSQIGVVVALPEAGSWDPVPVYQTGERKATANNGHEGSVSLHATSTGSPKADDTGEWVEAPWLCQGRMSRVYKYAAL